MTLTTWECSLCRKRTDSARFDEWQSTPIGWLTRQRFEWGELQSDDVVCSHTCAMIMDAHEETVRHATAVEYRHRRDSGSLSDIERLTEQMYQGMADRLLRDTAFYEGDKWEWAE